MKFLKFLTGFTIMSNLKYAVMHANQVHVNIISLINQNQSLIVTEVVLSTAIALEDLNKK